MKLTRYEPNSCQGGEDHWVEMTENREGEYVLYTEAAQQIEALRTALEGLVKLYIANPDGEFISCITPPHSSDMTPKMRKADRCWSAWDAARAVLQSAKEGQA